MSLSSLPALNAALNATSAALLLAGFLCIRTKRISIHALCMVSAFVVSGFFLASYLIYHARVGVVRFLGTGWIRPVYFTILFTHTLLAVAIVPLAVRTLFLAGRRRFAEHRQIARWTFPLWLYVSVTGVIIYWMLYRMPEASACPACKEALFDPSQLHQKLSAAKGYALSIGLLLSVPSALVGGITLLVVRASRRRTASQRRSAPPIDTMWLSR